MKGMFSQKSLRGGLGALHYVERNVGGKELREEEAKAPVKVGETKRVYQLDGMCPQGGQRANDDTSEGQRAHRMRSCKKKVTFHPLSVQQRGNSKARKKKREKEKQLSKGNQGAFDDAEEGECKEAWTQNPALNERRKGGGKALTGKWWQGVFPKTATSCLQLKRAPPSLCRRRITYSWETDEAWSGKLKSTEDRAMEDHFISWEKT